MRCAFLFPLIAACIVPCCSTAPPNANAGTILIEAEQLMAAGDSLACLNLLQSHDKDQFPATLQPQYELLLARSEFDTGNVWQAHMVLRNFADDHPHSELRDEVIDLQYQIGKTLCASNQSFLFFYSDRHRGRVTLEHLVTRYPDCIYLDDALRLLGDMAFEDRDYERAEQRYQELMRRRPESEWVGLARFRFAMSITRSLRGPEYDFDKMQQATKELQAFLENPPENPKFIDEAHTALRRLLDWQAQRHVIVADFYARVDNPFGEIRGLELATSPEFDGCPASEEARRRLEAMGEVATAKPANQPAERPR